MEKKQKTRSADSGMDSSGPPEVGSSKWMDGLIAAARANLLRRLAGGSLLSSSEFIQLMKHFRALTGRPKGEVQVRWIDPPWMDPNYADPDLQQLESETPDPKRPVN